MRRCMRRKQVTVAGRPGEAGPRRLRNSGKFWLGATDLCRGPGEDRGWLGDWNLVLPVISIPNLVTHILLALGRLG